MSPAYVGPRVGPTWADLGWFRAPEEAEQEEGRQSEEQKPHKHKKINVFCSFLLFFFVLFFRFFPDFLIFLCVPRGSAICQEVAQDRAKILAKFRQNRRLGDPIRGQKTFYKQVVIFLCGVFLCGFFFP